MHPNAALVDSFYRAFARRDAAAMNACYAPGIRFEDAAFGPLEGDRARAMWSMLCERAKDFRVEHRDVVADDARGSAHWEAHYTFSGTGRTVHNVIDADFEFAGGLIVRHTDRFDFHRWCGMALGPHMRFLSLLPPVRGTIRKKALAGLDGWIAKRTATPG
ncbi:MAG: nuclear transport factor 2 family protein [Polyangiaceae bacterium]